MHRSFVALAPGRPLRHRPSCFVFRITRFRPHPWSSLLSPDTQLSPWLAGSFLGFLQPPNFGRCPSRSITSVPKIERRTATLVTSDEGGIPKIPTGAECRFSLLRKRKGWAYFDRTKYISILEHTDLLAIVFLRPRRFGKSLALSMLECFHDVSQKGEYESLFKVCGSCVVSICLELPVCNSLPSAVPGFGYRSGCEGG